MRLAGAVLIAVLGLGTLPARAEPGDAASYRGTYSNAAGERSYDVHVPARHRRGRAVPLVVVLHGCTESAAIAARRSRMNSFADREGFLVAYPEQSEDANGGRCWNWFQPDHQQRDTGEPSLIAGITRTVARRWRVDRRRIFLAGISAGGAMTDVVAATYPDLFAAAAIYAGCEYRGLPCAGGPSGIPPETSGELAYRAAQGHARVLPVLVSQGDVDAVVPAANAEQVVQQWLATDDWADDGVNNRSVGRERARTRSGTAPGGLAYDVDTYTDGRGCVVAERWLVHGMGHAWSAAEPDGSPFVEPRGPDITQATAAFFAAHPMPAGGRQCQTTDRSTR